MQSFLRVLTSPRQFGNVLVLAAAYLNSPLNTAITQSGLLSLIRRTIAFLERQSFLPQTCKVDYAVLRKLVTIVAEAT